MTLLYLPTWASMIIPFLCVTKPINPELSDVKGCDFNHLMSKMYTDTKTRLFFKSFAAYLIKCCNGFFMRSFYSDGCLVFT